MKSNNAKAKWTPNTLKLLGTMPDAKLAYRIGLSASAVLKMRRKHGIRAYENSRADRSKWGTTELGMLGRYPDAELARITGRTVKEVAAKRTKLQQDQNKM